MGDEMRRVFFFHGLESGPLGSKFEALSTLPGVEVSAPDFRGMNTAAERLAKAVAATEGCTDLIIVGSSFGGLVAGLLASKYPERVARLVLCAPALHRAEAAQIERVPESTVIHGAQDDIVPLSASQAFCDKFGLPLVVVQDGHRLAESSGTMLDAVRAFLA
jgi:predicted esterase